MTNNRFYLTWDYYKVVYWHLNLRIHTSPYTAPCLLSLFLLLQVTSPKSYQTSLYSRVIELGHRSWKIGPRIRSSHDDKWFNFWFSLVRILPLCENFFLKCLDSLDTTVFTPNDFQSSSVCTDATLHHVLQAMLHPEHSIRTNAGPPYLQYKF